MCFVSLNFKYWKIDKVKKIRPMILVSGQIANDLNVGDKKIEIDIKNKMFLS